MRMAMRRFTRLTTPSRRGSRTTSTWSTSAPNASSTARRYSLWPSVVRDLRSAAWVKFFRARLPALAAYLYRNNILLGLGLGLGLFLALAGRDLHDVDGVADHVGGALLAFTALGILALR
jgi:hypothetical protein